MAERLHWMLASELRAARRVQAEGAAYATAALRSELAWFDGPAAYSWRTAYSEHYLRTHPTC